jgi:hypothetical protein
MRWIAAILLVIGGAPALAQTETPTPTPTQTPTATFTPTPEPFSYATVPPLDGESEGQMTRFDYVVSAGDVHIANLLTWLIASLWGMFIFTVIVLYRFWKR